MQSQGSTSSSQPSLDSLSSSDSLLFSDSDDADVFLTDGAAASSSSSALLEAAAAAGAPAAGAGRASDSPGSQWACDGFAGKEEEDDGASPADKSQGDLLFAQKCAELQGFVRPLLELLNGLKKGRFDRGLSSFQQSVAMDRIQRIVGVLQKPNSGEKYLNTLLQVEMMLKLWFPHVATLPPSGETASTASTACSVVPDVAGATPPHKHRDQLHIPVKKRRLSWTGSDSPTPSPGLPKCPRLSAQDKHRHDDSEDDEETEAAAGSPCPPPPPPPLPPPPIPPPPSSRQNAAKGNDSDADAGSGNLPEYKTARGSEPSLTWVHVAPILSPRKTGTAAAAAAATQDSAVSSTTPPEHRKNLKKASRCQSHADAADDDDEHREGDRRDRDA
ncbi:uncharacterized protein LOC144022489 [Festucalex cinctus]